MYYKKIYAALLSISIFALVSCATTPFYVAELTQIQAQECTIVNSNLHGGRI